MFEQGIAAPNVTIRERGRHVVVIHGRYHDREERLMRFMEVDDAVQLIQMEYAEMPELKLTFSQAQRLWNLSSELCERALATLVSTGYLTRTPDGAYVRSGDRPLSVQAIASLVRAM
jgi:Fic family protein